MQELTGRLIQKVKETPNVHGVIIGEVHTSTENDEYPDLQITILLEQETSFEKKAEIISSIGNPICHFYKNHLGIKDLVVVFFENPFVHVQVLFLLEYQVNEKTFHEPKIIFDPSGLLNQKIYDQSKYAIKTDLSQHVERFWFLVFYCLKGIKAGELFNAIGTLAKLRANIANLNSLVDNQFAGNRPNNIDAVAGKNLSIYIDTIPKDYSPKEIITSLESLLYIFTDLTKITADKKINNICRRNEFVLKFLEELKFAILEEDMFESQTGNWKFDAYVAKRYDQIPNSNIPNYSFIHKVLIDVVEQNCSKEDLVIDFGCSTGKLLKELEMKGHTNLIGIDESSTMLEAIDSKKIHLIQSNTWPNSISGVAFTTLMWTLHFIELGKRKKLLIKIFKSLKAGGTLVISDKVNTNQVIKNEYVNFKKDQGLKTSQIEIKKKQIEGVLITNDISWYFKTLEKVGFVNIEIIDYSLGFLTISGTKP